MPGPEHSGTQALPGACAAQGVVAATVRLPGVLEAAATRAAGDDTADHTELHHWMVHGVDDEVYSPAVLRLRDQPAEGTGRPGAVCLSPDAGRAPTVTASGRH